MTRQLAVLLITALALLLLSTPAPAQQFEDIGDYRVHYNALNSSMLPPEVARAYGIQRAGNRALLNIAVLRKAESEDELDEPVTAEVSARVINLTGQRRDIELQEIEDQGAIYYIGTFRIHDEESLTFTLDVKPDDSDEPAHEITFRQQFFTD
jgi:hypothetical protein